MTLPDLKDITVEYAIRMCGGSHIDNDILIIDEIANMPLPREPRRMQCLLLALCTKGSARYFVDSVEHKVEAGDLIIINQGRVIYDCTVSPAAMEVRIEESWKAALADEFAKPYFVSLARRLHDEKAEGKVIYPPGRMIFKAFELTPVDKVKVVILGQDPYHGPGQAMGLSFSVPDGITFPPSLINIFKEIQMDLGTPMPATGDLTRWAKQGVLLLNATLTVRAHQAASHQRKGWEEFTDAAIKALSKDKEHLVFILWGGYARSKANLIDMSKHLILESVHPSPLSANRGGWFGNHHFSRCNAYLQQNGIAPIQW